MLNFYDFIQVFVFTRNHHLNTDNDYSFSLFDCLLNVLILTFSVCGISYYLWTLLTGFHSIFIICHVYCSINKHSWAD